MFKSDILHTFIFAYFDHGHWRQSKVFEHNQKNIELVDGLGKSVKLEEFFIK